MKNKKILVFIANYLGKFLMIYNSFNKDSNNIIPVNTALWWWPISIAVHILIYGTDACFNFNSIMLMQMLVIVTVMLMLVDNFRFFHAKLDLK